MRHRYAGKVFFRRMAAGACFGWLFMNLALDLGFMDAKVCSKVILYLFSGLKAGRWRTAAAAASVIGIIAASVLWIRCGRRERRGMYRIPFILGMLYAGTAAALERSAGFLGILSWWLS